MKKKIAFIKYCGASAGGTEKYLQTIAAKCRILVPCAAAVAWAIQLCLRACET